MAKYVSANGFIQFPTVEREANGQDVLDVTIKTQGSDGKLIRVTLWPELREGYEDPIKGDWIAVDGKLTLGSYTGQDGETKNSIQISATSLAVTKGRIRKEREVVNADQPQKSEAAESLF